MESTISDLTQIAVVVLVAVALGLLLVRLRQPPMVGYILTGIVLGPTALGLVEQSESIKLLAEIGVLLLLFLIGMELSLRAFMMVIKPALLTASLQILASLAITCSFGYFAGWTIQASILLGFAMAVSSTALVIKMLEDIDELRSDLGRITVGVLIAQDLAIVPILLLSESLGSGHALDWWLLGKMVLAIGSLFALIWALARPGKVVIPFSDRIAGKPDLLTLFMLAICLAGAALSGLFGLSPIYGAFVAGLIVGQSNLRSEAIPATHPVQSLLIVVFFLSIGLLIDLNFIGENWPLLLAFVGGVIILKSVFNVAILRFVGEPWETAFPGGIIMSQIGEFSFVIVAVGLSANVIDYAAYQAAIAVIGVSLLISPFWLITVRRFHDVAEKGVKNFRVALAQVYEDEIAEFEKGAAGVRRASRAARRWALAAQKAAFSRGDAFALRQPGQSEPGSEGFSGGEQEVKVPPVFQDRPPLAGGGVTDGHDSHADMGGAGRIGSDGRGDEYATADMEFPERNRDSRPDESEDERGDEASRKNPEKA